MAAKAAIGSKEKRLPVSARSTMESMVSTSVSKILRVELRHGGADGGRITPRIALRADCPPGNEAAPPVGIRHIGLFAPAAVSAKTPAYGLNAFQNPAQVYSEFRPCVLGYDTSCG